jgi:hypothetical protein
MTREQHLELVQLLGAIGLFNERGTHWSEATPERIEEIRAHFRQCLDSFLKRVDAEQLAPELLAYLRSTKAVCDASGEVYARLLANCPPAG